MRRSSLRNRLLFILIATVILYVVAAVRSTGPLTVNEQIAVNEGY